MENQTVQNLDRLMEHIDRLLQIVTSLQDQVCSMERSLKASFVRIRALENGRVAEE